MKRMLHATSRAAIVATLLAVSALDASAQQWGSNGFQLYTMPGLYTLHTGVVNNSGQVAATRYNPLNGQVDLGIFTPAGWSMLATGPSIIAHAINNAGEIAGRYSTGNSNQGFLFNSTGLHLYGDMTSSAWPISEAYGLNDAGAVTGYAYDGASTRSFIADNSSSPVTAAPGQPSWGAGYDINNAGTAVGQAALGGYAQAVMFTNAGTTGLGSLNPGLAYQTSIAYAINNAGTAVGYSTNGSAIQAFVSNGGVMTGLGSATENSVAYDIDSSGRIVGYQNTQSGGRAVFYESGEQFFLDAIVGGGWWLGEVRAISDNGRYMVAHGGNSSLGYSGHVLLEAYGNVPNETVTPEPITMTLLGTGLAGVAAARRRRSRSTK